MKSRENWRAILIIGLLELVSYQLHTKWTGTPLSFGPAEWQEIFDLHHNHYPFCIRVLTTQSMIGVHNATGLPLRESFMAVQFTLMAVFGMVFFRYLRRLGIRPPWAEIGLGALMLSLPILYAFSEPIHTWDDSWGYLFLTLCAQAIISRRFYWGSAFFLLACFAREQSLLYYPAFAVGVIHLIGTANWCKVLVPIIAPLMLFGAYAGIVWQPIESERFRLLSANFESFLRTRDTLYSVFMAFGWLWVGWMLSLGGKVRHEFARQLVRFFAWGSVYFVSVTIVFALTLTQARETRILFPPVVLMLPLVMSYLQANVPAIRHLWQRRWIALGAFAAAVMGIGMMLGHAIFPFFLYRNSPDFSRLWAGVQIGLILVLLAIAWLVRSARRSLREPGV